jgi:hypothetical protein
MSDAIQYRKQFLIQCEQEMEKTNAIPLCLVSIVQDTNQVLIKWDRGAHGKRMSDYLRQVAKMIDNNEI